MGRNTVAKQLRATGVTVHSHDSYFSQNTTDDVWLRDVGRRRWIVITKDKNIRKRPLEREALITAKVRAFVFTGGNISGIETAEILVRCLPRVLKVLETTAAPFIARITAAGDVAIIESDEDN